MPYNEKPLNFKGMDENTRIRLIKEEIQKIKEYLEQDAQDGYILRGYVRQRYEERLETLYNEL